MEGGPGVRAEGDELPVVFSEASVVKTRALKMNADNLKFCGDVAQLGEHCLCKAGVVGSIPIISTKFCGAFKDPMSAYPEHGRYVSHLRVR